MFSATSSPIAAAHAFSYYSYAVDSPDDVRVGGFSYTAPDETWEWSDEVFALHGFQRGDVVPSTELLLAHCNSHDRSQLERTLRDAMHDGGWALAHYRLVDNREKTRRVMLVAESDGPGASRLDGAVVDMTAVHDSETRAAADDAVARSAENRASIEQAKGWLMATQGLDADGAFEFLATTSQHSQMKVFLVAQAILSTAGMRIGHGVTAAEKAFNPTAADEQTSEWNQQVRAARGVEHA